MEVDSPEIPAPSSLVAIPTVKDEEIGVESSQATLPTDIKNEAPPTTTVPKRPLDNKALQKLLEHLLRVRFWKPFDFSVFLSIF